MTDVDAVPDQPDPTDQHLAEVEKRADETIAKAREVVDRAKETLHDQILPRNEHGYGEDEIEDQEVGPERDDTRGAWPH